MLDQLQRLLDVKPTDNLLVDKVMDDSVDSTFLDLQLNVSPTIKKINPRYEYANLLLCDTFYSCAIEEAIITLTSLGYGLDEAIDDVQNTILHWLVLNAPIHLIRKLSYKSQSMNVNVVNLDGETPLMLAAKNGRQQLVNLLITLGASLTECDILGFTAIDYAALFSKPIHFRGFEPTIFQTNYENLLLIALEQLKAVETISYQTLVEKLFELYIAYMRHQGWQYEGVVNKKSDYDRIESTSYILDCRSNMRYKVNCFDIANGFVYLLKAFGINELKLHVYENNIRSKPFTPKDPKIHGEFVCFDNEAQAKILSQGNYYSFLRHCVVVVMGRVYDPTFCCHYDNLNDVVHVDEIAPKVTFTYPKRQRKAIPTFLKEFSTKLSQSIFSPKEWDIKLRKEKISVISKRQPANLEMLFANNLVTFTSQNRIAGKMMSQVLELWKKSLPNNLNFQFDVFSIRKSTEISPVENIGNIPPVRTARFLSRA
jgi:dihydroneopterin aldolase